jgi:4-hydroxybutyrate CoA-transferase
MPRSSSSRYGCRSVPQRSDSVGSLAAALTDSHRIVFGQGCGAPRAILEVLDQVVSPDHETEAVIGLLLRGQRLQPISQSGAAGPIRVSTWQPNAGIRALGLAEDVQTLPFRFRDLPAHLGAGGAYPADTLVFLASADWQRGTLNLGMGCDYVASLIGRVPTVIACISDRLPRTRGQTEVAMDAVDYLYVGAPDVGFDEFESSEPDEVDSAIAANVASCLRVGDVLEIGIGRSTQAVTSHLDGVGQVSVYAVFREMMIDNFESGKLTGYEPGRGPSDTVYVSALMGGAALASYADDNPRIALAPCDWTHSERTLGAINNFVAINSGLEIDLGGQVNAEYIGSRRVSGMGGQLDFAIGAKLSPGGRSVFVMRSTDGKGRTKIVPTVAHVTTPGALVDFVVTEHGVADLRGKTVSGRALAIAGVAAPEYVDELSAQARALS